MPKLVLVATHCAGRKLLDERGNEGQIDFLYDEACDMGCEYTTQMENSESEKIKF